VPALVLERSRQTPSCWDVTPTSSAADYGKRLLKQFRGMIAARWKEANVTPAPKVHPPQVIEAELRPSSLTATLSKLLVFRWLVDIR